MGKISVGTASWTDASLIKSKLFYPPAEDRLRYDVSQFPIVEVDSSYYAIRSASNAEKWVNRKPAFPESGSCRNFSRFPVSNIMHRWTFETADVVNTATRGCHLNLGLDKRCLCVACAIGALINAARMACVRGATINSEIPVTSVR
jgi:hypothetical protein